MFLGQSTDMGRSRRSMGWDKSLGLRRGPSHRPVWDRQRASENVGGFLRRLRELDMSRGWSGQPVRLLLQISRVWHSQLTEMNITRFQLHVQP